MKCFILALMLALSAAPAFAQTINPNLPTMGAWDGTQFQILNAGAYDSAATTAAVEAYVAAHPAPLPPAPPTPPAPTSWYVNKVNLESRFLPNELARLMAIEAQVNNLPLDWQTTTTAPWPTYVQYGVIGAIILYRDAEANPGLNVMDPRTIAFVNSFPALGVISYADYTQPTDGSTPLTSAQWSAQRIAAILATN